MDDFYYVISSFENSCRNLKHVLIPNELFQTNASLIHVDANYWASWKFYIEKVIWESLQMEANSRVAK